MTRLLSRPRNRTTFDAPAEAARLKTDTRARRRRCRTVSRLDRHTHELLALYDAGTTVAELQRWLEARRVRVHQPPSAAGCAAAAAADGPVTKFRKSRSPEDQARAAVGRLVNVGVLRRNPDAPASVGTVRNIRQCLTQIARHIAADGAMGLCASELHILIALRRRREWLDRRYPTTSSASGGASAPPRDGWTRQASRFVRTSSRPM